MEGGCVLLLSNKMESKCKLNADLASRYERWLIALQYSESTRCVYALTNRGGQYVLTQLSYVLHEPVQRGSSIPVCALAKSSGIQCNHESQIPGFRCVAMPIPR